MPKNKKKHFFHLQHKNNTNDKSQDGSDQTNNPDPAAESSTHIKVLLVKNRNKVASETSSFPDDTVDCNDGFCVRESGRSEI